MFIKFGYYSTNVSGTSSLVGVNVDETTKAMVSFVAINEPVTMYRVARGSICTSPMCIER